LSAAAGDYLAVLAFHLVGLAGREQEQRPKNNDIFQHNFFLFK